jgi:two-component system chemotaxis response regulator CheY
VILVTSMADKANVVEAVRAGANNYCIKPFTADTLHKCIEKTLAAAKKAA